jgi:hypothetical protein
MFMVEGTGITDARLTPAPAHFLVTLLGTAALDFAGYLGLLVGGGWARGIPRDDPRVQPVA